MSPEAEHDASRYGHGISDHEDGILLHIATGPWQVRHWTGSPDSLWPEDRRSYWIASVWARCGRGLTWKVDPPAGGGPRPCGTCRLSDDEIAARHTRLRPVRPAEAGHAHPH
ncbi:hypothetical protein ACH4TS_22520 [Streptomyces albidoflavus]|uniref:hypothetical protein n=1 Tax=Streptomyces sp. B29(2018) TaxID=2485016 RepID=UPI000FD64B35|nr:hypothetical protein [Streptomyces sp. B29(2018)]